MDAGIGGAGGDSCLELMDRVEEDGIGGDWIVPNVLKFLSTFFQIYILINKL